MGKKWNNEIRAYQSLLHISWKKYYKILLDEFPNTDFSLDAKFKLLMIDNILASKEIYIGNYYVQRKKWIPAINRYKNVVENYIVITS